MISQPEREQWQEYIIASDLSHEDTSTENAMAELLMPVLATIPRETREQLWWALTLHQLGELPPEPR